MAKSNAVVAAPTSVLPSLPHLATKSDSDLFDKLARGSFLPRLQLEGSNSRLVQSNKIKQGYYALILGKEVFEDQGPELDVWVMAFRAKAMDMSDKRNLKVVYDVNDPEFGRIKQMNEAKQLGFLWGPEFLIWIPRAQTDSKFATFFCGSPTARNSAADFKPLMGKMATLKSRKVSNDRFTWDAPVILACDTLPEQLPAQQEVNEVVEAFLNPKVETIVAEEIVEEPAEVAGRAR